VAERSRLQYYINSSSTEGLLLACRDEVLKAHQEQLLAKETGIQTILVRTRRAAADVNNARDDLSRMYRLYSEVENGLVMISEAVKKHISDLGNDLVQASECASTRTLVPAMIKLYERFLVIVREDFQDDALFQKAFDDAFRVFVNPVKKDGTKNYHPSHELALHSHSLLKKGMSCCILCDEPN